MIGYIEFEKEYKIGNLKLDFFKNQDEAFNTVILAGENGCGKTAILEAIERFQNGIYLRANSSVKKVIYFDGTGQKRNILKEEEAVRFTKSENISDYDWANSCEFSEQDFYTERFGMMEEQPDDIRNKPVVFSEARSGFDVNLKTENITYSHDTDKYEKDGANYSGLIQLLIDLEERDNSEYLSYAKFNTDCTYDEFMKNNSSVARFKRAFEEMFDGITYLGKDPRKERETVYFVKGNKQIDIDELSTGEKQIVFRGTDLLYHAKNGATVIIDEPELSLHPKWQKKILNFYRNLFTDDSGKQIAQIIIATHSEYVIQSAMAEKENVKVLILKRDGDEIKANVTEEMVLGIHSIAEVNYLAFGVEKVDYHIQLFSALHNFLQSKPESGVTNTISSIDRFIKEHSCYDSLIHERDDASYNHYYTLPVYIRNAIDHPDGVRAYNDDDLEVSIQLLRKIYKTEKCIY